MMRFATLSTTWRWMRRLRGRAPYTGSSPSSDRTCLAPSVSSSVMRSRDRRSRTSASWMSTIFSISSSPNGWNTTTSSIRLRNSGLKVWRRASLTLDWTSSGVAFAASAPAMYCEPTLLVMMMIVFLKLTTRPWPSVSLPSSSTWSRTLKTSGCAFSISSSRMTLYGRLRTASVS